MRLREPRRSLDDDNWPRELIPNKDDYRSEASTQSGRKGNDDFANDYDEATRKGFYYQANNERSDDEYPARRNYPHPK